MAGRGGGQRGLRLHRAAHQRRLRQYHDARAALRRLAPASLRVLRARLRRLGEKNRAPGPFRPRLQARGPRHHAPPRLRDERPPDAQPHKLRRLDRGARLGDLSPQHQPLPDRGPEGPLPAHERGGRAGGGVRLRLQGEPAAQAPPRLHLPEGQHLPLLQRQPALPRLHPHDAGRQVCQCAPRRPLVRRAGADGLRRRCGQERLGAR